MPAEMLGPATPGAQTTESGTNPSLELVASLTKQAREMGHTLSIHVSDPYLTSMGLVGPDGMLTVSSEGLVVSSSQVEIK